MKRSSSKKATQASIGLASVHLRKTATTGKVRAMSTSKITKTRATR